MKLLGTTASRDILAKNKKAKGHHTSHKASQHAAIEGLDGGKGD